MPKINLEAIEQTNRTGYPSPFDQSLSPGDGSGPSAKRLG